MKIKLIAIILFAGFLLSACTNTVLSRIIYNKSSDNHLILGSTEYIKKISNIANSSGNRNALSVIMVDVDKYSSDLEHNSPNNILRFHKLVSSLIYKIGYVDMQTHYFRNKLNRVPKSLKELIRINRPLPLNKRWRLLGITGSGYHIQGIDGEYNLKFVSNDGFCEAVYNKKGILLNENNDPINMGTYNYAAGIRDVNAHVKFDVSPYLLWGNTPNSPQKGSSVISKCVNLALINYKKHAASVYLLRKNLFGMQQGSVP
jgi:hypothetical protein